VGVLNFKSFKDLNLQIEMHEDYLEVATNQLKYYNRLIHKDAPHEISAINYDGQPHGNGNAMSFDRIYLYKKKYESIIEQEKGTLQNLKDLKVETYAKVLQLDSLDYKVVYLRDIEDMSLMEIAELLHYDYDYIKKISFINKKVTFR
jgi:DNA-directed RNA polymerase specialized sigma24 family protein